MKRPILLFATVALGLAACGIQEGQSCELVRQEELQCSGGTPYVCICGADSCEWADAGPEGSVDFRDSCWFECNEHHPVQVCPEVENG